MADIVYYKPKEPSTKQSIPMIADPTEQLVNMMEANGFILDDKLNDDILAVDYPRGTEEEFLRHYILGAGGPFVNFVNYVDIGVGFEVDPIFKNENEGLDAKKELEDFFEKIDFIGTLMSYGTYYEVLGRSSIVITGNALGDDFFYDENADITGIDCVNPMSYTWDSIKAVRKDRTGNKPYIQVSLDEDDDEEIPIAQDRVIYRTRTPFTKTGGITGISMYHNAIRELRATVKFPRYREQTARKFANIFTHYTIDQEKMRGTSLGAEVLLSPETERAYLLSFQEMMMRQELKHSSIATFDWIKSSKESYGGKEPQLDIIENMTMKSLAGRLEVPLALVNYQGDTVNRSVMEVLSDFFVQRRKNGPQKKHRAIATSLANLCLEKWGYEGTVKLNFNPFVRETLKDKFDRISNFNQKTPVMSDKEIREQADLPADRDGEITYTQNSTGKNPSEPVNEPLPAENAIDVRLEETIDVLCQKGIIRRI